LHDALPIYASMTGCVFVVRFRSSAGPPEISEARFWPSASEASSSTEETAALPFQASSMPTDCEPCPGNTKATFIVSVQIFQKIQGKWRTLVWLRPNEIRTKHNIAGQPQIN